jgi:hypothetical protein
MSYRYPCINTTVLCADEQGRGTGSQLLECDRSLAWECARHARRVLLQAVSLPVIACAVSSALSVSVPYA